jgi:hypothetical protein
MSFDLYFVSRHADQSWQDAVAALEENAETEGSLTDADLALWVRLEVALRDVLPASDSFHGDRSRELTDEATGIQVSLYPGELSLSVPYWYSGPDAEDLIDLLRRIAGLIEDATGLTAYDPQAEAPFLGAGAATAAGSFDMVHNSFNDRGITPGQGTLPPTPAKPRWRRFLGR